MIGIENGQRLSVVHKNPMTSTNSLQAFDRGPRLARTTPELDAREVEWWDANATLIERIWGTT